MIIYGAFDDLIEISGGWHEEIPAWHAGDDETWICCSDGTILKVEYAGEWKLRIEVQGQLLGAVVCAVGETGEHADFPDATSYSDIATFRADLAWVCLTRTEPARGRAR